MKERTEQRRIEELCSKANKCPYYRTISMKIEGVTEEGSVLRVRSGVKHRNLWGTTHGGVLASLVDSACGVSIAPHLKQGEAMVTIELHIDYVAPVAKGDMIGRGTMIHRGRRLARSEAVITDEGGRLLAKGHASFMITEAKG